MWENMDSIADVEPRQWLGLDALHAILHDCSRGRGGAATCEQTGHVCLFGVHMWGVGESRRGESWSQAVVGRGKGAWLSSCSISKSYFTALFPCLFMLFSYLPHVPGHIEIISKLLHAFLKECEHHVKQRMIPPLPHTRSLVDKGFCCTWAHMFSLKSHGLACTYIHTYVHTYIHTSKLCILATSTCVYHRISIMRAFTLGKLRSKTNQEQSRCQAEYHAKLL